MKLLIKLMFLLTFASMAIFGQVSNVETRVDDYIRSQMSTQKIPGMAIAVVKDGKPLIVKGYGLANVELSVAVKPETIFQSGSMGKQFTAAAVMLLVEEGKVSLDEKINKYVGTVPDAWKDISVRQVLTHTAGMPNDFSDTDYVQNWTEDQLLAKAKAMPLDFKPGTNWSYSNVGYVVLGIMVGKVSGKFYGDFLQERIFKPLGMTTTRIISEADIVPNRAAGYRLEKGELKNQEWVSPTMNTTADGSIYWSILDLVKWDAAITKGQVLKPSSWASVYTPVKLTNGSTYPYGFGWGLYTVNGKRLIEHGGSWQGFKTAISRYVDDGLTVIVLANLAQADPGVLSHGVAEIVAPELIERPIKDDESSTTAAHRKLLESAIAGSLNKDLFSSGAQTDLLPRLESNREQLKAFGPIEKFELLQRIREALTMRHRYLVKFKEQLAIFGVVLDDQGKIAGLRIQPKQ
ncbi:MAG TPA: serine hydrolase domain-containing protein [Pyrinomonadaceae bacterium]|nr:serine hydrolase domain-containing protein [Pyrinomonadaceae bacterium]